MPMEIKLVAFDLFGTLVRYGVMHHPYRKILRWAKENGRPPRQDDARQLMTINDRPEMVFNRMGIYPSDELLTQFYREIHAELHELTLFDDVSTIFKTLTERGVRIAICSNLAEPYGAVIEKLLSQYDFIRCLSYEVGAIKPEPEIYADIVNQSHVRPSQILFVGDTFAADVEGPMSYGFLALHLKREGKLTVSAIRELTEILS